MSETMIEIPQEHQGKDYVGEGFADQGAMFNKIAELHGAANAPMVIPENFKDEKVFETVKGEDGNISKDKMIEALVNQSKVIGKKTAPFDYKNASENEITEHLSATRPENIDAYDFGEKGEDGKYKNISDDDRNFYGEMLMNNSVNPFKGNKIIKTFMDKQNATMKELLSPEGFKAEIKKSFEAEGDWEKIAGGIGNIIKGNASEEDQAILNGIPNKYMGAMYRMMHKYNKAHGINDADIKGAGGAGSGAGGGAGDVEAKRTDLRKQIDAIKGKPNSSEKIIELNKQLVATYTAAQDKRLTQ